MKNGFRSTLDLILKKYGMTNRDAIGTVWTDCCTTWNLLNSMNYRIEIGVSKPTYDYIIICQKKSTIENILNALTKINNGCIIVFKITNNRMYGVMDSLNKLNSSIQFHAYSYNNGMLGVLFKGKDM